MKKIIKRISLTLLLCTLLAAQAFSATWYDNGSQRFTITAGPTIPTSLTLLSSGETFTGWEEGDIGLTPVGGFGSIAYQVFLNPYLALGGEIGYAFNYNVDGTLLTNVPMLFKLTVMPLQGRVEIPLSFGLGFSYMSISDGGAYLPFFASFETGIDYYFTDNWGIGLKCGIWVIPEIYFESSRFSQNSLLTMVPITLSVTYRQ